MTFQIDPLNGPVTGKVMPAACYSCDDRVGLSPSKGLYGALKERQSYNQYRMKMLSRYEVAGSTGSAEQHYLKPEGPGNLSTLAGSSGTLKRTSLKLNGGRSRREALVAMLRRMFGRDTV